MTPDDLTTLEQRIRLALRGNRLDRVELLDLQREAELVEIPEEARAQLRAAICLNLYVERLCLAALAGTDEDEDEKRQRLTHFVREILIAQDGLALAGEHGCTIH